MIANSLSTIEANIKRKGLSMNRKLVSIIVPTYNAEKNISACIESLLVQTYENIEIIVIDDGSTDKTLQVLNEYYELDKRIRIIPSPHSGVSSTRNRGIQESNGTYITFVDADDYVEKELIEKYVNLMENENVSLALCGMFHESLIGKGSVDVQVLEYAQPELKLERTEIVYLSWLKIFNFVTNKVYKLDKIRERGIFFKSEIHIGEDLEFNLDYLEQVDGQVGVINSPLYHYMKRSDNSLSLQYYHSAIEHTKHVYHRLIQFIESLPNHTEDDIEVLQSIYLYDWTSRLTALFEDKHSEVTKKDKRKLINHELRSEEFQDILERIHRTHKISFIRYMALKTKNYIIFYSLRNVYHFICKKIDIL